MENIHLKEQIETVTFVAIVFNEIFCDWKDLYYELHSVY